MADLLSQLQKHSKIIADTANVELLRTYQAQEALCTASSIRADRLLPHHRAIIESAVLFGSIRGLTYAQQRQATLNKVFVDFGLAMAAAVPGRVHMPIVARHSFNTQNVADFVRNKVLDFAKAGLAKERLAFMLPASWECINACRILEKEGICCNMTLVFSASSATACADAGAAYITIPIGRILDWYRKVEGFESYPPEDDPSIELVRQINSHLKERSYKSSVIAQGMRSRGQVFELCGLDSLALFPKQFHELLRHSGTVTPRIEQDKNSAARELEPVNEDSFRWILNENSLASEMLAEGIRQMSREQLKLGDAIFSAKISPVLWGSG